MFLVKNEEIIMSGKFVDRIERTLTNLQVGVQTPQIYDDWLSCVEITLRETPNHLEKILSGNTMMDSQKSQETWSGIKERYKGHWETVENAFADALSCLLESSQDDYRDVVGESYMRFGNPNPNNGQFFTPMPMCKINAFTQIPNGGELVISLIRKTIESGNSIDHLQAQALILYTPLSDHPSAHFVGEVLPAAVKCGMKPITIDDCAVGSGAMLLAMANCFPQWAVHSGLVQFYGTDIDASCVKMARINCMLYGLNGHGYKLALALTNMDSQQIIVSSNESIQHTSKTR